MSYLADDIVWIVADNSPLADRSPYHGIAAVRSDIFERLTAGFDKLVFDVDEIFECNGGERVVALGYYYFKFHGQGQERKAQVAHVWTIRDGRAVKFQQYLDTLQVARDAGTVLGSMHVPPKGQPCAGGQPLAVAMRRLDFMKQFSVFATLASASGA